MGVWDGWWVVRWSRRLVHIEADDAEDAVQGFIEALRGMGDWTKEPGELSAFPYVEYRRHARPMEFARAAIDRGPVDGSPERRRMRVEIEHRRVPWTREFESSSSRKWG